nr:hypothetical protein JOCKYQNQ_JOCKYQNQ_CDS_0030 [Autographiviridae sp.]
METFVKQMHFEEPLEGGVCAKKVSFDILETVINDFMDGETHYVYVKNIKFTGGCPGNLAFISKLLEGMQVEKAYSKMNGNKCGKRKTSCVDQFAQVLLKEYNEYFVSDIEEEER